MKNKSVLVFNFIIYSNEASVGSNIYEQGEGTLSITNTCTDRTILDIGCYESFFPRGMMILIR